jgi:ribosomal protein S18 acetylase RimI-like enzyme
MNDLRFSLARPEHAKAIEEMRRLSAEDLTEKLGLGYWSGKSQLRSIRERIQLGDWERLQKKTLFVVERGKEALGSVAVTTWPPGFWPRRFFAEPKSIGLGVFDLVVFPRLQRAGLGRFLMDSVERLAESREIRFVRLDAFAQNPYSNAFYERIGYTPVAEIDVRGCGLVLYEKRVDVPSLRTESSV